MILVDTSVWIEVFRAQRPLDIEAIVDFDEIVTCLPVIQEVLQGFRDERAFRLARDAMLALPIVVSPLTVSAAFAVAVTVPLVVSAPATVIAEPGSVFAPLPLSVRLP